ncbi:MAG: methyltransferase domain-containing protein [Acidobacteriia bacterium]|nr:methyltransferase domain-containing protein [Terriglobia bacterium]
MKQQAHRHPSSESVTRSISVHGSRLHTGHSLFFFQSLRSLTVTASLFPSSRFLAAALSRPIDFTRARVIVELGMGTGAITRELLRRMQPGAVLYGVDINPAFITHVERKIRDSRFVPILGGAERLGSFLHQRGIRRADAIVSSLGLTSMGPDLRSHILEQAAEHLSRDGVLTQYQYLQVSAPGLPHFRERDFLREYFREVASERVIWNLPPANVYTCRL